MQQFIYVLFILSIISLSTSCKLAYYPNKQSTPLLEKKHDVQIDLGLSDYQLGYAITDHFAIFANGHFLRYRQNSEPTFLSDSLHSERFRFDGGLGYFNSYSKNASTGIYVGGGVGRVFYRCLSRGLSIIGIGPGSLTNYQFSANTTYFYAQPYWRRAFNSFDILCSTRLTRMEFYNVTYNEEVSDRIRNMGQQATWLIEPSFTHIFGKGPVKGFQQIIIPLPLNNDPTRYAKFAYSFGIQFLISPN